MTRRRRWLVAVLALVAVLGLGGAAYAAWGPGGTYAHALVTYGNAEGEPNRYVNLPDGRAQLAIGSPDSHRIVVQWRDPDGHGWTSPETVWTEKRLIAVDNTVRYGRGTVAVRQVFVRNTSDDSDSANVVAGIVCADRRCLARRVPGTGGEAQVTPDGRTVLLGEDESGVVWWTARRGIHAQRWSGRPADEYDVRTTNPAVLSPDGALRVVSAAVARNTCSFELLGGDPGSARISEIARYAAKMRGTSVSQCRAYFDTPISTDWIKVYPDDHRSPDFWFIRRGGAWSTTLGDPSGLVRLDRGDACCSSVSVGFVHWNDLAFGSPDGRRIQLQHHLLGQERWSRPVLLDGAPAGYACDSFADPRPLGREGAAVLLRCRAGPGAPGGSAGAGVDAYALAVSADLRHWSTRFVTGVRDDPQVRADRLVVGDTTWSPDAGFSTR